MKIPLSIYIHWPFCKAKCPYCDFNSHVRDRVDHARWRSALRTELAYWAGKLQDREVVSVFFGGGTPSLMQPETVAALLEAIAGHWSVSEQVEITLEANPTSIEAAQFRAFAKAGINRVSVGIQAFNTQDLAFLGRQHTTEESHCAINVSRETFSRFTFDLIYARPQQSLAAWEAELNQALTLAGGHLSLYQLTIEENTAFHTAHRKGAFIMPEEGLAADMYRLTQAIMLAHEMPAYEISNHAKPGEESRHNLAYWRGDDYIGIGPGAHGRWSSVGTRRSGSDDPFRGGAERGRAMFAPLKTINRIATETIKSPERWLEKVEQSGTGLIAETTLSPREHLEEVVMMGLRLAAGIDYADWRARTGLDIRHALNPAALARMTDDGFITADAQHIKPTAKGALLLNRITAELLAR